MIPLLAIGILLVSTVVLIGLAERHRPLTRDERRAVAPSFPEALRLVGEMPSWLRPDGRDGAYAPRDIYYAGRDAGHSPSVMRKRLLGFSPPASRAARRWWRAEVETAYALDKSLPKARRKAQETE